MMMMTPPAFTSPCLSASQVVFAVVNSPMLKQRVPAAVKAVKYSQWAVGVVAAHVGLPEHNYTARVVGGSTSKC